MRLPDDMSKPALLSALFHGSILAAFLLAWPKDPPAPADPGMTGSVAVMFVTGGSVPSAAAPSAQAASTSDSESAAQEAAPPAPALEDFVPMPDAAAEAIGEMAPVELEVAEPPPPLEETALADESDLAPTHMAELSPEPMPEPLPPLDEALEVEKIVERRVVEEQAAQRPKPLPATKPTPPRETAAAVQPQPPSPQPLETQIASPPTATNTGHSETATATASPTPPSTASAGAARPDMATASQFASLETGAKAGMSTGSGSVPGLSADEQADYASLLAAWLDRHKEYPDRARRKHQEGVVLCEFAIDRQGKILSYRIVRESGYELLDEEASDLMARANPVPPPPAGMDQTYLVPIVFALN
jgi:periplasmic protein TonB